MKHIICLLLISFFSGALAKAEDAPKDSKDSKDSKAPKELKYITEIPLDKKDAFNAVVAYLAKNLGDSNLAIKVKDAEAGTIVTQIAFECKELRTFLDLNKHLALFNLDVAIKDKKIKIIYEPVSDEIHNVVGGKTILKKDITLDDNFDDLKKCTERSNSDIVKAASSKPDANW